ncbi:MAG: hypothetical protein DYG91_10590, partial [Chloroflexi bacterium CFX7]|nr:hypothetical protein [Chloroflexi bacterium CFX7]
MFPTTRAVSASARSLSCRKSKSSACKLAQNAAAGGLNARLAEADLFDHWPGEQAHRPAQEAEIIVAEGRTSLAPGGEDPAGAPFGHEGNGPGPLQPPLHHHARQGRIHLRGYILNPALDGADCLEAGISRRHQLFFGRRLELCRERPREAEEPGVRIDDGQGSVREPGRATELLRKHTENFREAAALAHEHREVEQEVTFVRLHCFPGHGPVVHPVRMIGASLGGGYQGIPLPAPQQPASAPVSAVPSHPLLARMVTARQ